MAGLLEYDTTAGNNTAAGDGTSVAEGVDAGLINNGMRAIMADLADWRNIIGGSITAGGSANALTVTTATSIASYADGMMVSFVAASANTSTATLSVDAVGAKAIRKEGDSALEGGEIKAGGHYLVQYDASANGAAGAWLLLNPTALDIFLKRIEAEGTIASASTTDIGAETEYRLNVTGTTTITSFGTTANSRKLLRFSGALTLTHNATSLILPGAASVTTAAGDVFEFASDGSGNWRCVGYTLADGTALVADALLDEDDFASDSDTQGATQQSIKSYVDSAVASWSYVASQATTSGTAFDFTSIPSGTGEIELFLDGCSLSGADHYLIQLGDAGGIESSGYNGGSGVISGSTPVQISSTSGFPLFSGISSGVTHAVARFVRANSSGTIWYVVCTGNRDTDTATYLGGEKELTGELTQLRLTRTGSNTFDAGAVSLRYR